MTDKTSGRPQPTSLRAIAKMKRREKLFEESNGLCFYCGCLVTEYGYHFTRDWLLLNENSGMQVEHKTPIIRGGSDLMENTVCSCQECNKTKGTFTLEEFRLLIGLRRGDLNYRFAGESRPEVKRDWILCHSTPAHERELHIHNMPTAAVAYGLRNGFARKGAWSAAR
jgi:5-methylcytosine-specific restriction endonuclease McrA